MGICPFFKATSSQNNSPKLKNNAKQGGSTDRPLNMKKTNDDHLPGLNLDNRKMSISQTSNNASTNLQKQKAFTKNGSTGIGMSQCQKKLSSIFSQGNSLESSSIVITNPKSYLGEIQRGGQDFYTLIDKVVFVRKSMDSIKVSSPHGQSQLKCPYPSLLSTFYVSEGLPLQSIKEISCGKIIQISNSPLKVTLRLQCKNQKCKRIVKIIYAKSIINTEDIQCDKCGEKDNWKMLKIESNAPIWGDGRKIENDQQLELVPSPLRALGCILCLRYQDCSTLDCGCLMCHNCAEANTDMNCHICQALE